MIKEFTKGLFKENPVFRIILGLCPALAVTTKAVYGISMGLSVIFVLFLTAIFISLIRKIVPDDVRIGVYIVIIAAVVTLCDIFLKANFPDISKALGPYVPLIVVNCIIFGRAEAYFSRNNVINSVLDGLGMGAGFTLTLILVGGVREIIGSGTFFGFKIFGAWYPRFLVMILPAGGFITLGVLMGVINYISRKKSA
ncbi:MAG TPA: electron transport complex subunit RsxE [bacterium]|nr:electron transport complex subunit RsxE [bacterium]